MRQKTRHTIYKSTQYDEMRAARTINVLNGA
jgi:hypothetical protein